MNQPALKTTALPDRVACLMVSLSDRKLLLPITAVAEVINTASQPEAGDKTSALYGWINWRDQRIPMLSVEAAMGAPRPALHAENRIAVLNAIGQASDLGYYGVLLQGLPTPVQVNPESLRETDGGKQPLALCQVSVGGDEVLLPDFAQIEVLVAGFPKA
jgi:chemosensory pili system protein ChpC